MKSSSIHPQLSKHTNKLLETRARMGMILLLSSLLLRLAGAQPGNESDTTPPQLVEFSIAPTSIDVTAGAQRVIVTMRITDDLSGLGCFGRVEFVSPSGQHRQTGYLCGSGSRDAVYEVPVDFPQFIEPGTWRVAVVFMLDVVGNARTLSEADLTSMGFPTQLLVNPTIRVAIDIKPGSLVNVIDPNSKGVLPVAILTANGFNATTVDPLSVKFGPNGATEIHKKGHIQDVDGDGDLDMVLHFNTLETGIQCGNTQATLTGKTFGGQAITSTDAIQTVECGSHTLMAEDEANIPAGYALAQNYPNPFNPSTVIRYDLPTPSVVTLKVYNVLGQEVATLVGGEPREAGRYEVRFDGTRLASGIYFYRLDAISLTSDKKLISLKKMLLVK